MIWLGKQPGYQQAYGIESVHPEDYEYNIAKVKLENLKADLHHCHLSLPVEDDS